MPPPRVPEEGHLPGTRWPMSAIHQPPRGFGPGLGPRKALLSPRDGGGPGCICKLLTAQPAATRRQAGSRGLERACRSQLLDLLPCQWLPGKGDSD